MEGEGEEKIAGPAGEDGVRPQPCWQKMVDSQ